MFIRDFLIPYLIGRKDLRSHNASYDDLVKQATTFSAQLKAQYLRTAARVVRRRLWHLKRRIGPMEIDHDRFLKAVDARVNEIPKLPGLSEEAKTSLIQSAQKANIFTIENNGKRIVIDLEKIKKNKLDLCLLANKKIVEINNRLHRLLYKNNYRLSTYIRTINNNSTQEEIKIELDVTSKVLEQWDFSIPFSSSPKKRKEENDDIFI